MKILLILFGPPGAGKSFAGKMLSHHFGFNWYEADDDLTPEMHTYIQQEKLFTDEMRENYFAHVTKKTQILLKQHEKVAVSQALMKEKNRQQLLAQLPTAHFIYLTAPWEILAKRLKIYQNNKLSLKHAKTIFDHFEPPLLPHTVIDNSQSEHHLLTQLNDLYPFNFKMRNS